MSEEDELLSVSKSGRVLGVSAGTVREWEKAGLLVARRTVGGHRRFRLGDLLALRDGA
jgi:excisionase family DNA binding protein